MFLDLSPPANEIDVPIRFPSPPDGFVNVDVNLEKYDCRCCGSCTNHGIRDKAHQQGPPTVLLEHDLSYDLWQRWMIEEWDRARSVRYNCFGEFLIMMLSCCLYPLYPCYDRNKDAYADTLNEWQRRFNEECLNDLGMQVKLRSHCFRLAGPSSKKPLMIMHALTFAFTPEARTRLSSIPSCTGLQLGNDLPCCTQKDVDRIREKGIIIPG